MGEPLAVDERPDQDFDSTGRPTDLIMAKDSFNLLDESVSVPAPTAACEY